MQEKKIWTLVALAMLTALTLVRPERALDGRVGGRATSRSVRTSSEKDAIVSDRLAASAFPPHAGSAWLLFRADWGAVLWRVYQKMNENRLLAVAAGVVFYGLLAVFPALTAFVSLYGLMADPSTIHERLALATGVLPQGALNILNEQLTRLTSHRTSASAPGSWRPSCGAMERKRGRKGRHGRAQRCLRRSGEAQLCRTASRYGPSLSDPQWTWLFPGNVIAAVSWLDLSAVFSWYIAHFGSYDATYGSWVSRSA